MKTMGLADLSLVSPRRFPDLEASAMASGADDILGSAQVCSLDEALEGVSLIFGTSARLRSMSWPQLDPPACIARIRESAGRSAILFGQERAGLTNDQLARCNFLVHVPTVEAYRSLNLAATVQILCYEWRMAEVGKGQEQPLPQREPLAQSQELEHLYGHLEQTLIDIDFLDPNNPRLLMRRFRRLFSRIQPTRNEIHILRGVLSAVDAITRSKSERDERP